MHNNFLRVITTTGTIHYININHIYDIHESELSKTIMIEIPNNTIHTYGTAVDLIERIYKIQQDGKTKYSIKDTE